MITEAEMTDVIYDTLMGNTKPSHLYPQFDLSRVDEQEVDNTLGHISFRYGGVFVRMNITAFP